MVQSDGASHLEKDMDYRNEHLDFIQMHLRFDSHPPLLLPTSTHDALSFVLCMRAFDYLICGMVRSLVHVFGWRGR